MQIRRMRSSDDFAAISCVYALSWKAAYRGIIPNAYLDAISGDGWTRMLTNSLANSIVLLENGEYIGTASICPARDETRRGWGEIISIYLLPEYFGKGYGKPLLDAAVSGLEQMGFKRIYLWVLKENNRARGFYEKNGFLSTSTR